ncbi:MAG TPA: alpha/beta hydrolase [Steroidobacteraceae bacterium]|jgi:pimeloyl-ACP methyl ester carboxylesterase|nr:alpha/beta hydrolase [Steroidobacteraceae bacterium]
MPTIEGYLTTQDGVRLHYRKVGTVPPTVIIPNAISLFDDFRTLADGRTLIFYDLRNRGRSDAVSGVRMLERGIHHDVEDLEAVREHFGIEEFQAIGFSYLGMMVILYAMQYPGRISRAVQLGPIQPDPAKSYPATLTNDDGVLREVVQLMRARADETAREVYRAIGPSIRRMFVAHAVNVHKLDHWDFADIPNEVGAMKHWLENIEPSIRRLQLTPADFERVRIPVLTIHGRLDRNAPYGGGREWALVLPDARLETIEHAAHASWVDAPERVFSAIRTFLGGDWPATAEKVTSLESDGVHAAPIAAGRTPRT